MRRLQGKINSKTQGLPPSLTKAIRKPKGRKSASESACETGSTQCAVGTCVSTQESKREPERQPPARPVRYKGIYFGSVVALSARLKIWKIRARPRRKLPTPRLLQLIDHDPNNPPSQFRLYPNEEVPMMSSKVLNVEMREPSCDNDCPTEVKLLESSARYLESQIANALAEFSKDHGVVKNLAKYTQHETLSHTFS